MKKITLAKLIVLLITVGTILSVSVAVFVAADRNSKAEITVGDIKYTFTFDEKEQTACLNDIDNPEVEQTVTVPGTVLYNDKEYTVTDLSWSYPFSTTDRRPNVAGLILPNTLQNVHGVSFYKFPGLTEISIPGSIENFDGSFQNSKLLTGIVFEEGVKEISSNTMIYNCTSLVSISLPSSLRIISGPGVFSNATALKSINLPEGVIFTENLAFSGCTSLTDIELPASVTEIPAEAFQDCTALTSVTAKGSITSIGRYAFSGASSLKTIPDLSHVSEMGVNAFYNCTALGCAVDLSSLINIPDKAFSYAPISEVTFCDHLESIGIWAFIGGHMTTVNFPETLQSIGTYAFWYAGALTGSVTIPESVTYIGTCAFQGTSVTELFIDSGLTEIPNGAFSNNVNLKKVTFDNSEEDVLISDGAIPDGVEIVFLRASMGDVGETISEGDGAMTLQEAVNASQPGDTIIIEKNIKLNAALIIPAEKDVIIKSENEFTVLGNKLNGLENLIRVEEGASVTFGGKLILSGRYNSKSTILNNGKVTLTDNASVANGRISSSHCGVIHTDGKSAAFIMAGGSVENNTINTQAGGVIRVSGGASVSIQSGTIQNNRVIGSNSFNSSSGILLYEDSTGEMAGGAIVRNSSYRGSAIMLYSLDYNKTAYFRLSGGEILDNSASQLGFLEASGAVHIEGNANFIMDGGKISGNKGRQGAGVCVLCPGIQKKETEYGTAFIMNGGEISANAGRNGGGIYSYANGVKLNAGMISNNTAEILGGGIYSEGNDETYSTLHIINAVITGNSATEQGGGLWLCPTGDAKLYVENGGAIYKNTAGGAGDDVVSLSAINGMNFTLTLANRVLGGGKILWYQDGAIFNSRPGAFLANTNSSVPRYGAEGANTIPFIITDNSGALSLKSVVDPSAFELAQSKAALFITGNSAYCGGGIGANGGVVIGKITDELKEIPVKKLWEHGANPEDKRPASITVKLMNGNVVVDTLVLDGTNTDDDGSWIGIFEGLPVKDSVGGEEIIYTIIELPVEDYVAEIIQDADTGTVITNKYVPRVGNLTVSKTVSGNSGDITKAFTFTVTLSDTDVNGIYGDLVFVNGVSIFTLKHGESKTSSGLPAGVSYTVTESDNSDYTVTVTGGAGIIENGITADAVFTNYKNDSPDGPDVTDKPSEPDEPNTPDNTEKPITPPPTGDDGNTALWIVLMLVSCGVIICTVIYEKKNVYNV